MAAFDLPWANSKVINATKKLRVGQEDAAYGLSSQVPMVPDAAPNFPFQDTTRQELEKSIREHYQPTPWTPGVQPTSPTIPSQPLGVPTPTPTTRTLQGRQSLIVPGSDEAVIQQRAQADYDPRQRAALESGGFFETQAEIIQREKAEHETEREMHQFERRMGRDSYAELVIHNTQREAAGLDPRPMDGLEAMIAYDKEVLDPIVYAAAYGAQKAEEMISALPGGYAPVYAAKKIAGSWGGYSKGEGWELENRVDEILRNSASYPQAQAAGEPITSSFEGAIRQAAEEELLPWFITEPAKVVMDPLGWPVGGVPFVRGGASLLPRLFGGGVVRLKNAGTSRLPFHLTGVAQAAGDPAQATKRKLIEANRAFFDVEDFDYRLAGNGRIEIVLPEEVLVRANSSAEELFSIPPLKSGLSGTQRLMSEFKMSNVGQFIRGKAGKLDWMMTPENTYVTPAMEARNIGLRTVKSVAAATGRVVSDIAHDAFKIHPTTGAIQDRALLEASAAYDITLKGGSPTINDIAARLPYYWDAMTPKQRRAMESLRITFGRVGEAYTESGYPKSIGSRADVMLSVDEIVPAADVATVSRVGDAPSPYIVAELSEEARQIQGFYIHRGEARKVRGGLKIGPITVERPVRQRVDIGRSEYAGAPEFTKPADFESMSEAMAGILAPNVDDAGRPILSAAGQETNIIQRYQYSGLRHATTTYVEQVGEAVWDMHISNYLKNLIDPVTGEAFIVANTTRIPKNIRAPWMSLKRRLATARESNRRIINQMVPMDAETARLVKEAERRARASGQSVSGAAARAERARLQQVLARMETAPLQEDMRVLQEGLRDTYESLGALVTDIKNDRKILTSVRHLSRTADTQLTKHLADADLALDDAKLYMSQGSLTNLIADSARGQPYNQFPTSGSWVAQVDADALQRIGTPSGSWEEWFGSLERIDGMRQKIDELAVRSDGLHAEVDGLKLKGTIDKDQVAAAREGLVADRRALRVMNSRDREIRLANHEYKMLAVEQARLERLAAKDTAAAGRTILGAQGRRVKADVELVANRAKIQRLNDSIEDMSDRWHNAVSKARGRPDTGDIIPLPGLGGYYFPDAMANAARVFIAEPGMKKLFGQPAIEAFNQLYRGARGTLDNSRFLIQMLLRHYDDPRGMLGALKLSYHAFGVPGTQMGGERAVDAFFRTFDDAAKNSGRLNSREWARHGLVITGADTEFQLGGGALTGLGKLPLIANANRAFGALGDYARLTWADDLVEGMLKKKPIDELIRSGDLEDIAQTVNNASGWAPGRFGGSLGDLVLFAPRFLQSRLNTLGRAAGGSISYATKPFGAYGWQGVPGSVGQRAATRSVMRMMVLGTLMTFGINEMMGRETEFKPLMKIDGKWVKNPNFMRVHAFGRDTSLFGTWDSLLGMMITAAQGDVHEVMRSMASGMTRNVWDFGTGNSFTGERTRDTWPQGIKHMMENIIPFVGDDLQGHADNISRSVAQRDVGRTIGASVLTWGTLHGLKTTPMSLREELTELRLDHGRDLLAQGAFDVDNNGRELSDAELDAVSDAINVDPRQFKAKDVPKFVLDAIDGAGVITEKKEAIAQQRRERGSDFQVMVDEGDVLREVFHATLDDALAEVGLTPAGTQRVSGQLKDALIDATSDYASKLELHRSNFTDVIDKLDQLKKEDRSTAVYNLVREDIFATLYDPDRVDALGRFDYEGYQADEDKIRTKYDKYTDEQGNSIVDSVFAGIRANEHSLQTQWREAKKIIEPWFNVPDEMAEILMNTPGLSARDKALFSIFIKPGAEKKTRDLVTLASKIFAERTGGVDVILIYNQAVDAMRTALRDESISPGAVSLNEELVAWDLAALSLSTMRLGNIQGYFENLDPEALKDLIEAVTP